MAEDKCSNLWRDLVPLELLRIILSSLPLPDLIRSSAVCKTWQCIACEVHQPQLPWICTSKPGEVFSYSFYSYSDGCCYTLPSFPDELTSYFYTSTHEDWLIFTPDPYGPYGSLNHYYLYNPFSTAKVLLPPIPKIHGFDCNLIFSSSPSDPDCIAAVISYQGITTRGVSVCCGLRDEWRLIPNDMNLNISDIVFFNRFLYALRKDGTLMTVDTQSSKITSLIPAPTEPPAYDPSELVPDDRRFYYNLLVFKGQLLMICFFSGTVSWMFNATLAIFKANFEIKRWEVVDDSLGRRHTLFYNTSFFANGFRASEHELWGIEGNCFYLIRNCYDGDMLFCVTKENIDECFDYVRPAPNVWYRDRPYGKRQDYSFHLHFFITPKCNFTPVESLMKRLGDSLLQKDPNLEKDKRKCKYKLPSDHDHFYLYSFLRAVNH